VVQTESTREPGQHRRRKTALQWCCVSAAALAVLCAVLWGAIVIYFGGNGGKWRVVFATGFLVLSVAAWIQTGRLKTRARACWVIVLAIVAGWFLAIRPSHARNWKREVSVLPRIMFEGDRARITGLRDFHYRSRDDFDAGHKDREVELSHLVGVDLLISYWDDGPMAHTFLSFTFDNADPICISIEARPEEGEAFAALPALFKRFELIYVVGSERDIVRVRTNHRNEQVYLYSIKISTEAARRLFLVYAKQINRLADEPEFYHLLRNSCTANIVRNARAAGHTTAFDGRFILNGLVDQYLYETKLIDTSLPFEETRIRARITEAAQSATLENFSKSIRANR